jgi:hypothetical protein
MNHLALGYSRAFLYTRYGYFAVEGTVKKIPPKNLSELREEMRAVARGERKPSPPSRVVTRASAAAEGRYLLDALKEAPATYTELRQRFGTRLPTIARQLVTLKSYGLVKLTRVGDDVLAEIQS